VPPVATAADAALERARGALLGTFVGDALGMPFEGVAHNEIPFEVEMVPARRGRGTYTDDTQMMIALAESLVERGRVEEEHLARCFHEAYEPDRGYGSGTRRVFELWATGTPVATAAARLFGGEGSRGNGAAMRIAPISVRYADDPVRLCTEAARSAKVTHAHPVGVDAAVVQAAAIGAALRGEPILDAARRAAGTGEMGDALRSVVELVGNPREPGEIQARLGSSSDAGKSVPAAVYAALALPTFEEAVRFAVRLGGDTDTVAAMTGAIAGARHGVSSIPSRWLEALEDGDRGRSFVNELAARLLAVAMPRPR
jgi:poly(ADP-ribose) glycohydrolase ARH3